MKERIYCIYDNSEQYALRLADYINRRHLMPGQVVVYTSEDALIRDADKYEVEVLMLVNRVSSQILQSINAQTVVYLTDEYTEGNYVNPYQSANHLVKEVMSYMSGIGVSRNTVNKKGMINCIYSPAGKCFKTTIALMLALWSSHKGRSLYINLEQFAGLGNILSDREGGLSEALYQYRASGRAAVGRIISCTGQLQGMDYFYPVTCAEDISELQEKDFMEFINLIIEAGIYDFIWIDIGTVYSRPWRMMEICDRIFLPNAQDYVGLQKVREMENYLVASGRSELLSRIEKLSIQFDEECWNKEISLEYINNSKNRVIADKILEGENCG